MDIKSNGNEYRNIFIDRMLFKVYRSSSEYKLSCW